ncbi:MAG: N-acetyltransferase [Bacteroidales bacterium]|nr:N-acetyltransferase [Bacteroidales bacterium]
MNIRIARQEDLPAIVKIYNQTIATKNSTAEIVTVTVRDKTDWFYQHIPDKYPLFVAEVNHSVVGWASLSPYRPGRDAFRHVAEISFYLHKDFQGKGLGTALIAYVLEKSSEFHFHQLIAMVLDKNTHSIHLLEKFGFKRWAYMPGLANFDGQVCAHVYYGLTMLKEKQV